MKNWKLALGSMALVVLALTLTPATGASAEPADDDAELPPGMTAEQMAAWEKATTPGPEHQMLAAMAGSWTFKGTFWMAPDAPPMVSAGTSERTMILGGRVLLEKVHSEWQGDAFEGLGMTGFDNVSGEYWGTWTDSAGTGMMLSTGTCAQGVCEFSGTYNDPMVGGPKTLRMTMVTDGDREVHASYEPGPDGEFKSMELVYLRER